MKQFIYQLNPTSLPVTFCLIFSLNKFYALRQRILVSYLTNVQISNYKEKVVVASWLNLINPVGKGFGLDFIKSDRNLIT